MTTMTTNETRAVVEAFFAAWAKNDERGMRSLMADDLAYANPMSRYESADAFIGPLVQFSKMLRGLRLIETMVSGDRAAILYDCDCPLPVSVLKTAWFVRVEAGKLRTIESVFDTSELRKILSRAPSSKE